MSVDSVPISSTIQISRRPFGYLQQTEKNSDLVVEQYVTTAAVAAVVVWKGRALAVHSPWKQVYLTN